MGSLSPAHWIIVLIVAAILFFGWKQLPDMARSAGKSLRIFKTEIKGMSEDDKAREANQAEATSAAPPAVAPAAPTMAPPPPPPAVAPPAVAPAPPAFTPGPPVIPPAAMPPTASPAPSPPAAPSAPAQSPASDNHSPRAD
jgi:sec-independent protein translocase protein TatA